MFYEGRTNMRTSSLLPASASISLGSNTSSSRKEMIKMKPMNSTFDAIYAKAHKAGLEALAQCKPTPMVVKQHRNMLDDNSPVVKSYLVPNGVCGFAWIALRPATSAFARWARDMNYAKKDSYAGGLIFWVREGGQSLELKNAYAQAFAKALQAAGFNAYAQSRID